MQFKRGGFDGPTPIGPTCQWSYSMKIESGPMVLGANGPRGQWSYRPMVLQANDPTPKLKKDKFLHEVNFFSVATAAITDIELNLRL